MNSPEAPLEADPFDLFESNGELCGYIFKKCGETGLRQLLAYGGTSKEWCLDIVAELDRVGLRRAAIIAAEVAASKLPADDLSLCPYQAEPYRGSPGYAVNVKSWQQAQERRQRGHGLKQ